MKNKVFIIIISVLVVAAIGTGVYFHFKNNKQPAEALAETSSSTQAEEKEIALEIIADGKDETFNFTTARETLGGALVEAGYVENNQEEYGLYIKTVYGISDGGRTCDDSKQEWWCVTKNGEAVTQGADSVKISNGDHYELTLKTGY
jgi:hypothetical protein